MITIEDVQRVLGAELICGESLLKTEVQYAFASDMMSDVLAFANDHSILLSGLVNPQVIRTAEMMDMTCIVFVRGKEPSADMEELAKERNMVLMRTPLRMFAACGLLYQEGIRGCD